MTIEQARSDASSALTVLRRGVGLVAVATLVGGALGYFVSQQAASGYESSVRLLVGPVEGGESVVNASSALTATFGELVSDGPVLVNTARQLGLDPDNLDVVVDADTRTRVLSIVARHGDPTTAELIAAEIPTGLADYVTGADASEAEVNEAVAGDSDADAQKAPALAAGSIQVISPATAATTRTGPALGPTLACAAAGALVAMLSLLVFSRTGRRRPELSTLVPEIASAPLLGQVHSAALGRGARGWELAHSQAVDQLSALEHGGPLLLVSARPYAGGAPAIVRLAVSAAATGRRVLIVDSEARSIATALGFDERRADPSAPGRAGVVEVPMTSPGHVRLIPWRPDRWADGALAALAEIDDLVIIHGATPTSQGTGAWARALGRAVLFIAEGSSLREDLSDAVAGLTLSGAQISGAFELRSGAPRLSGYEAAIPPERPTGTVPAPSHHPRSARIDSPTGPTPAPAAAPSIVDGPIVNGRAEPNGRPVIDVAPAAAPAVAVDVRPTASAAIDLDTRGGDADAAAQIAAALFNGN